MKKLLLSLLATSLLIITSTEVGCINSGTKGQKAGSYSGDSSHGEKALFQSLVDKMLSAKTERAQALAARGFVLACAKKENEDHLWKGYLVLFYAGDGSPVGNLSTLENEAKVKKARFEDINGANALFRPFSLDILGMETVQALTMPL